MSALHTPARFSNASIALHWLMAVLLVVAALTRKLKGNFSKGSAERELFKTVHYMLDVSVFALVWLRLLARTAGTAPPITLALPRWQTQLSHLVQLGLYVLMVTLPVLGWLSLSDHGKPVALLWGMHLPLLSMASSRDTVLWFKELHETGATVGYALVAMHAGAALMHHYFERDDTLLRILPRGHCTPAALRHGLQSALTGLPAW